MCDPFYVELSKREWFAGLAMQGLLAAEAGIPCEECMKPDHAAAIAVCQADALLTELAKATSIAGES